MDDAAINAARGYETLIQTQLPAIDEAATRKLEQLGFDRLDQIGDRHGTWSMVFISRENPDLSTHVGFTATPDGVCLSVFGGHQEQPTMTGPIPEIKPATRITEVWTLLRFSEANADSVWRDPLERLATQAARGLQEY